MDWAIAGGIDQLDIGAAPSSRPLACHAEASGPTAWMSEHVLGIKIIEPGCKVVKIEPNLGDLKWAEGTFPTPYGLIRVRHEKDEKGTIKSTVHAPDPVKIIPAQNELQKPGR
jgi:hypothetical protein